MAKDRVNNEWFAALGQITFIFLMPLMQGFYYGWALGVLWSWFIVPLGAPDLGIFHAAGIIATARLPLMRFQKDDEKKNPDWVMFFAVPLVAVFNGWLFTLFM